MRHQLRFLKIKIKSLAAEARIIRREEKRSSGELQRQLCEHRRRVVRRAARHNLLAYSFLRGRRYEQLERSPFGPDWTEVSKLVVRFGVCHDGEVETVAQFEARRKQQGEAFAAWTKNAVERIAVVRAAHRERIRPARRRPANKAG
jgi:hypothetical protein